MKTWLMTQAWKYLIAAGVLAAVTELAGKGKTRLAAVVLTLPLTSIVAYILVWEREQQLGRICTFAKETLVLVPLGLPFFVPLAFAGKWGLGFWSAFGVGVVAATACIALWLWLGPKL